MQPVVQLELFRNSKTDQKLPSRYRHRLPVFSWAAPYEGNLTINAEPTLPTYLPVVSIVVPFFGLPFRILNIELVKPKKELQWRL